MSGATSVRSSTWPSTRLNRAVHAATSSLTSTACRSGRKAPTSMRLRLRRLATIRSSRSTSSTTSPSSSARAAASNGRSVERSVATARMVASGVRRSWETDRRSAPRCRSACSSAAMRASSDATCARWPSTTVAMSTPAAPAITRNTASAATSWPRSTRNEPTGGRKPTEKAKVASSATAAAGSRPPNAPAAMTGTSSSRAGAASFSRSLKGSSARVMTRTPDDPTTSACNGEKVVVARGMALIIAAATRPARMSNLSRQRRQWRRSRDSYVATAPPPAPVSGSARRPVVLRSHRRSDRPCGGATTGAAGWPARGGRARRSRPASDRPA